MAVTRRVRASGEVRWDARVFFKGRQIVQRTFERKADAKRWEADQLAKLHSNGWVDPRRGRILFRDVAEEWQASRGHLAPRSQETTRYLLNRDVLPSIGNRPIGSLTAADISKVLTAMTSRGLSVNTQKRTLSVIRLILDYAIQDGRLSENVARQIPQPKGLTKVEPHWLTADELQALVQAVPECCRPALLALGLIGLRFSEMAALTVRDAAKTAQGWSLRVHRATTESRTSGELIEGPTKNRQSRTVPVPEALVPYVAQRKREAKPYAPLFPSPRGGVWRNGNFRRSARWAEVTKALGIEGTRLHDLRHTAASLLIASGADVKSTQLMLGHRSAQMTLDLYGHLFDEALWNAVRRLPAFQYQDSLVVDR